MRLFVALNFSDGTRARLAALAGDLASGAFVPPENLHLTLAFLCECGAAQASAARAAVGGVEFGPIDVRFEMVGRFRREGGDIWWLGVSECAPLMDLRRSLVDALAANGFAPDGHRFRPHVTLARRAPAGLGPRSIEPFSPFGETVRRMDLMESRRVEGRLTHTAIHGRDASVEIL
jgi:2'-5' RNA ligase